MSEATKATYFNVERKPQGKSMPIDPVVSFFHLLPHGRPPKRADRSAAGFLPSRALRFCDALTSATGHGYWLFPPIDIRLLWDGEQVFWSYGADETWLPLSGTDAGAVQFPGYAATFDATAPKFLMGCSPPFLKALPEMGGVQMWTGLLAKTRPGWSLAIRTPVNLPPIPGLSAWEGIIESDIWMGPLFTNFQLTKTDQPIHIRAQVPFLQVQPVPQVAYRDETLNSFTCSDSSDMEPSDWEKLSEVLLPEADPTARQGNYAVQVRRRRACPAKSVT